MRQINYFIVGLAVLLLLAGCVKSVGYTISGTVLDESGLPLAGVTIMVYGGTTGSTVTGADGRYTIGNLKGACRVEAVKSGHTFDPADQSVTENDRSVDFQERVTSYGVAGTIGNFSILLDGIEVQAIDETTGDVVQTTVTANYGRFSFTDLRGKFQIKPVKEGYIFEPEFRQVSADEGGLEFLGDEENFIDFAGGIGSEAHPFLIETTQHLIKVNDYLERHFSLENNLDLSAYPNWTPIGTASTGFRGGFEGQGHKISNLTITGGFSDSCYGLFGNVEGGTINDLHLVDAQVNPSSVREVRAGILTGLASWATITNCSVEGEAHFSGLSHAQSEGGGLIGISWNSHIEFCSAHVRIWGGCAAGFIGSLQGGNTIRNSYAITDGMGRAGFIGRVYNSEITNCYSHTGSNLFLASTDYLTIIEGCYFSSDQESADPEIEGVTYVDEDELKVEATFAGWDFISIWEIDAENNDGYPFLRAPNIDIYG